MAQVRGQVYFSNWLIGRQLDILGMDIQYNRYPLSVVFKKAHEHQSDSLRFSNPGKWTSVILLAGWQALWVSTWLIFL